MINAIMPINSVISYSSINNNNLKENIADQSVYETLQKAKAIFYQAGIKNNDPRVINLILMAEVSLKNGNPVAANNFARRAIQILTPEQYIGLNKKTHELPQEYKQEKINYKNNKLIGNHKETIHKYKDVSNDAGVSFSYPSNLTGPESFLAVPAHEAEHVGKRVSEAVLKGERILVSVSYDIRYDPATGEPYMAGGETRTIILSHGNHYNKKSFLDGNMIDIYA